VSRIGGYALGQGAVATNHLSAVSSGPRGQFSGTGPGKKKPPAICQHLPSPGDATRHTSLAVLRIMYNGAYGASRCRYLPALIL
jgi:hypothetical protein